VLEDYLELQQYVDLCAKNPLESNIAIIPYGITNATHALARNSGLNTITRVVAIPPTTKIINNDFAKTGYEDGTTIIFGGLRFVYIPKNVEEIRHLAFAYNNALSSFIIPKNSKLRTIGSKIFYRNDTLTHLLLPRSIESIADDAFEGMGKLVEIFVPWGEGEIDGAPWGAEKAKIVYNYDAR
jgi:hypothetical protein